MSSVVKTLTPFIHREFLLKALEAVGCKYTLSGNRIITDRQDYYGKQYFDLVNGKYSFSHDSSAENMRFGPRYPWGNINVKEYRTVSSFLQAVEKQYNSIYNSYLAELEHKRLAAIAETEQKRIEEEKLRIERERKEFVEKQKNTIVSKAKEQGYDVRETIYENKVKLVLVRTTY